MEPSPAVERVLVFVKWVLLDSCSNQNRIFRLFIVFGYTDESVIFFFRLTTSVFQDCNQMWVLCLRIPTRTSLIILELRLEGRL